MVPRSLSQFFSVLCEQKHISKHANKNCLLAAMFELQLLGFSLNHQLRHMAYHGVINSPETKSALKDYLQWLQQLKYSLKKSMFGE